MAIRQLFFLLLILSAGQLHPAENQLLRDLLIVDQINAQLNDRLPVTFDHFLQGGYLNMPSARMGAPGELSIGYSRVHPYINYNVRCQLLERLEVSANYRVFRGIPDPILSPHGFGDFSEKGANFRFAILTPEESDYKLPGFAFGMQDFHGTRSFKTSYLVTTKVFLKQNLEVSLGYGWQRIDGFFGGASWMPFRKWCSLPYLQGLSLVAEYDGVDYKNPEKEKHPKGREQRTHLNVGAKYRLWDYFDFSLGLVRGKKLAFSASTFYNFGETEGFLPKIDDSLPYTEPQDNHPLGWERTEENLVQEFLWAFSEQDLMLLDAKLSLDPCGNKVLRLTLYNDKYRLECLLRDRLNHLLAALTPSDIAEVIVVVTAEGFPIQEYRYQRDLLNFYAHGEICDFELDVVTPLSEVSWPDESASLTLFHRDRELYTLFALPKTHTYFGSSRGKFKCALGLTLGANGFLFDNLYYSILLGKIFYTTIHNISDVDMLNPSQLINVRTDVIRYYQQRGITLDQFYLQKNWNMGNSCYSRLTGGYFEEEYGGLAGELLYYPVNSPWAVGLEAASLFKRDYKGLGFTNKVRKLDGFRPTYRIFYGSQCFLNLYYDWECANTDFQVSAGKFVANDWGARFVVSKYFESGLRFSLYYTMTNAHDRINGHTYYDKGFEFSMPLDIFYTHSSREKWGYGMSAWLRDCGFRCTTGEDLYYMINDLRN
jgi:hypothetical protein